MKRERNFTLSRTVWIQKKDDPSWRGSYSLIRIVMKKRKDQEDQKKKGKKNKGLLKLEEHVSQFESKPILNLLLHRTYILQ